MKYSNRKLAALVAMGIGFATWGAEAELAWPTAASIKISQSTGKFDFLRIDPYRNRLLAAHEKDGTSDFIDLKSHSVIARVQVGAAVDTAVDHDSSFYYLSVQEGQRVAVLDAATLKEVKSIKMDGPTDAIIYEPKNRRVYVTHDEGNNVWVIDPATAKVVATVAIPGVPEVMAYDPSTDRIYLNIKSKDLVAVIDPATNKVISQWPTAPAVQPHGLVVDSVNHRIFSAGANGKLVAIDTANGSVNAAVDIVEKVDQIAFDDTRGLVYCAGTDHMSVVRAGAGRLSLVGNLTTAANAKNVAVDPATHVVWTTYADDKGAFAKGWRAPQP